ncbi:nucleoside-diphosphate-sugar epimerase [Lutibacter sp. Hel_I_33_5]|uniref:SDR family oxidoreductase n=1 Tax=Lutibacter sp. Hel_I_33_5 TaxID=1566289 RepID=UPI0011A4845E|nr:SDR family oxidoreductase [Lutibacter sp. Hel_I_33_5]TVZ56315.1 nucleoside-diphosphate-sugar epimerase [Lutibacter sp. Hel_I_33_5]
MILVTGGTGLVGSHLLYHLCLENDIIRAIYRTESKKNHVKKIFSYYTDNVEKYFSKIEWIQADITDVPVMIPVFIGVKKVYHCAALVSFNPNDYREMRKVNIHGTAIIVNLSIDAKIEKLCFVSSIAAVGDAIKNQVITEENEWNDQTHHSGYAITKFGAEMEVWRASQEGIKVVIVNPGVILGSGFWNEGTGKLFTQINNGFKYYTEGITGFVGVKDVVKSMILLLNSDINNERFILVAENKSFKEVFDGIATGFGKNLPKVKIKPWQTSIFWRLSWVVSKLTGKAPFLTKDSAKSAHSIARYSSEKISKQLNFEFEKIDTVIQATTQDF